VRWNYKQSELPPRRLFHFHHSNLIHIFRAELFTNSGSGIPRMVVHHMLGDYYYSARFIPKSVYYATCQSMEQNAKNYSRKRKKAVRLASGVTTVQYQSISSCYGAVLDPIYNFVKKNLTKFLFTCLH